MNFRFAVILPVLVGLAAASCGAAQVEASTDSANEPAVIAEPVTEPLPEPSPMPPPQRVFTWSGELTQGGWVRGQVPDGTVTVTLDGEPVMVDDDGHYFAAFDRDAGTSATLVAELANGSQVSQTLEISPRAWNIEHVNVARRPGGASEAFMRIRRPELEQIGAARAHRSETDGWRQDWIWPVKGRISGRFGSQRVYRGEPGSYHSGLDIATGESGTPFVAPADGVVVLAAEKPFSLEGHLLMIDHGNGLNSAFLHCSALLVKVGDHVRQGQEIGRIGSSGRATGPHLHWSIKWQNARLDPLLFIPPQ